MTDIPKRKHPRLKEYDYSNNGYYFVTICCQEMRCYFGSVGRGLAPAETDVLLSPYGEIAKKQLFHLEERYPFVKIDKFVIMPNHIHVIIVLDGETAGASPRPTNSVFDFTAGASPRPTNSVFDFTAGASPRPTLMDIICAYKSLTTRLCNEKSHFTGRKIFQTSFYEKIITTQKSYQEIWQYIDENPLKWALDKYYIKEQ